MFSDFLGAQIVKVVRLETLPVPTLYVGEPVQLKADRGL